MFWIRIELRAIFARKNFVHHVTVAPAIDQAFMFACVQFRDGSDPLAAMLDLTKCLDEHVNATVMREHPGATQHPFYKTSGMSFSIAAVHGGRDTPRALRCRMRWLLQMGWRG